MLAVGLGAVFAAMLFVRVPVTLALDLLAEDRAVASGTEVPVVECSLVRASDIGPFAMFGVTVVTTQDGVEHFDLRGPYPVWSRDVPTSAAGARAYLDSTSHRVVTSVEHDVRGSRVTAAIVVMLGFGAPIVLLIAAFVGRLREHLAVRRAARSSEELLVDVDRERGRTIDYQVTSRVVAHEGGYRTPAAPKRWLARYRQRADERPPMILSGASGRRMVVLRSRGASTGVVVRDDYWPFVVDGEARMSADARAKALADGNLSGSSWP